jgi:hypothetical protein
MKNLIIVIVLGSIVFIGLLYCTLRTKVRDVSNNALYLVHFNKKLILKRDVILATNKDLLFNDPDFFLAAFDINLTSNMQPRYTVPKGTSITLHSAKAYLNGVSGFETDYVIGTVYLTELKKEVSFKYAWNEAFYAEAKDGITMNNEAFNPVWENNTEIK